MTTYTVIGAGAVGLLYGGRLQEAGHDVTWVIRSDPAAVATDGIAIDAAGERTRLAASVVEHPSDAPDADVVLVALKSTANDRLAALVGPAVRNGAAVLLLQNGLGGEQLVGSAVPQAGPIVGGLCFVCAHRHAPGHVEHIDYGPVDLAELGATSVTPTVELLAEHLRLAGFAATPLPDLATARWRKLVWNVPFNGLSVVLDAGTDALMADQSSLGLVERIMSEVVEAGRACGADVDESFAAGRRDMTRAMTPYAPSMKLDHEAGRPMEIAAIYDAPIAAAAAAGVSMPATAQLRNQLWMLDRAR